jgi:D-arginine dehydrogenase
MNAVDVLVIGAGISGAAAASAIAGRARVALLEAEALPGQHTTGRSAALYTPNFGSDAMQRLNGASRAFLTTPPDDIAKTSLLSPRGALTIAPPGAEAALAATLAAGTTEDPVVLLSATEAGVLAPLIRPEHIAAAAFEPGVADIDVAALHQGFLARLRRRGGRLVLKAPVTALKHDGRAWDVTAGNERWTAPVVVNAAGAWGDTVAALAGAAPVGLMPLRRTALVVDPPAGCAVAALPLVEFAGHGPYLKPDGGRIMASLADETPDQPHDVQPDDMDVAVLVDWLERHTTITVRKAPRAWAGLRCFVADRAPVVGFDPDRPGFFWLVGQGGCGIMMAPTLGDLAAGLILDDRAPTALAEVGIDAMTLAPGRMRRAA